MKFTMVLYIPDVPEEDWIVLNIDAPDTFPLTSGSHEVRGFIHCKENLTFEQAVSATNSYLAEQQSIIRSLNDDCQNH